MLLYILTGTRGRNGTMSPRCVHVNGRYRRSTRRRYWNVLRLLEI